MKNNFDKSWWELGMGIVSLSFATYFASSWFVNTTDKGWQAARLAVLVGPGLAYFLILLLWSSWGWPWSLAYRDSTYPSPAPSLSDISRIIVRIWTPAIVYNMCMSVVIVLGVIAKMRYGGSLRATPIVVMLVSCIAINISTWIFMRVIIRRIRYRERGGQ